MPGYATIPQLEADLEALCDKDAFPRIGSYRAVKLCQPVVDADTEEGDDAAEEGWADAGAAPKVGTKQKAAAPAAPGGSKGGKQRVAEVKMLLKDLPDVVQSEADHDRLSAEYSALRGLQRKLAACNLSLSQFHSKSDARCAELRRILQQQG